MNNLFLSASFLLLILATESKAQQFLPSLGIEILIPVNNFPDFYSVGTGASVGAEMPIGNNTGITMNAGYILINLDTEQSDFIESVSMIPLQIGMKYYISYNQEGLYLHGQIGVHSTSVTIEDIDLGPFGGTIEGETESKSNLSFAIGGGYLVNGRIDLGLRYNIITNGEDEVDARSYLGFRGAYNF